MLLYANKFMMKFIFYAGHVYLQGGLGLRCRGVLVFQVAVVS